MRREKKRMKKKNHHHIRLKRHEIHADLCFSLFLIAVDLPPPKLETETSKVLRLDHIGIRRAGRHGVKDKSKLNIEVSHDSGGGRGVAVSRALSCDLGHSRLGLTMRSICLIEDISVFGLAIRVPTKNIIIITKIS